MKLRGDGGITVTLGSELREPWEGLGGAWTTREGVKLVDMGSERGGDDDDDDLGDGDPERLTPSLVVALARSLECRLPVGGFTNFEKKPGAICLSRPSTMVSVVHSFKPGVLGQLTRITV